MKNNNDNRDLISPSPQETRWVIPPERFAQILAEWEKGLINDDDGYGEY